MGRHLVWAKVRAAALGVAALLMAGCCQTGGPGHKCDFTPLEEGNDGGTDGPMPCGTAFCENGEVCCYKKVPAIALCIPPSKYAALGCEKIDLPCFRPSDCPGGDAVACCLKITGESGEVTCRPKIACVAESGYLACTSASDCPDVWPTCLQVSETPSGEPFSVCR